MAYSQSPLKIAVDKGDQVTQTYWNKRERLQWVSVLFLGTIVVFSTRTIMPLCAVTMAQEFDWDKTDMGLVLGCFFWGYPILQIAGGYLSDRIGGAQVMYRAAFVWSIIILITPHTAYMYSSKEATVYSMAFLRFLLGLAQGVHYPSLTSLVSSKSDPHSKAVVLTTVFAAGQAGTLVTGSVGSVILHHYDWSSVFYFFGFLGLLWAFFLQLFIKRTKKRKLVSIPSAHDSSRKNSDSSSKGYVAKDITGLPIGKLCSKSPFWGLFIAWVCIGYYFFILLNWLPTYFAEVFPGNKGWISNVAPWLVAIPSSILSGYFSGRFVKMGCGEGQSRKLILTISASGMCSSFLLVGFTKSYNTALILMIIATGSQAVANGALPVNIQDIAPNNAGGLFGILNTIGALQGFIGSYAAGYILHISESWSTVFCSTAGIAFCGWISFICMGSGKAII